MYRCFKLSLDLWSFKNNDQQFVNSCREYGCELKKSLTNAFDSILKKSIDENGVIAGEIGRAHV